MNWPGVASALRIVMLRERALLIPHAAVKGMLRHGPCNPQAAPAIPDG